MNFFARQDAARQQTRRLILLYVLAVICIIVAVDFIVMLLAANLGVTSSGSLDQFNPENQPVIPGWEWIKANISVVLWSTLWVVVGISLASLYKIAQLSGGGSVVAQSMGGVLVPTDVADPLRRQLRNVVEEVSIASGIPVPAIYVLEKESSINAFAAGFKSADAAVAVSRGCLETLSRDELQGVIAHEFSHIFNGDMRLNIRLMGLLFGIIMIGLAGRQIIRINYYSRDRKNAGGLMAVGFSLIVIGAIGVFFGRLIQSAVSRQREFLADASAVQFTRNPHGIAGALKKIAALSRGSLLEAADGEEVGHMLFADGLGRALMATHPSLEDRIRAIEPRFNVSELKNIAADMALSAPPLTQSHSRSNPMVAGFAETQVAASTEQMVNDVGTPSWAHVEYAAGLREQMDPVLLQAAHSLRSAIDLVMALLLDSNLDIRQRQLATITQLMGAAHSRGASDLYQRTEQMNLLHRLPLVELAFPALRRRPRGAIRIYLQTIEQLIRTDGEIDLFEFALSKLTTVYLIEAMQPHHSFSSGQLSLREVKTDIILLFSVMSKVGQDGVQSTQQAFNAGMHHVFGTESIQIHSPTDWVMPLSASLNRLDRLRPLFKQTLIEGLVETLRFDQRIALSEVELLRAVCACLHCPMPPQLHTQ